MTGFEIPPQRDLPAGRLSRLKDDLMAQIELDHTDAPDPASTRHRQWRRLALAAAAFVAVATVAGSALLGGDDIAASANTAERNDDGTITITVREGKDPEQLEQRLNDLGVPVVVDFLDEDYACDPARSTGWIDMTTKGLNLMSPAPDPGAFVLHPDALEPGQTLAIEFQIGLDGDPLAHLVVPNISDTEVGECVPVEVGPLVTVEAGG